MSVFRLCGEHTSVASPNITKRFFHTQLSSKYASFTFSNEENWEILIKPSFSMLVHVVWN